jgi:hypothetical protein
MSILAARLAPSYLAAGFTYMVDILLVVIKLRLKIKVQLLFAYNQPFFSAVTQFPNIPRLALCHGMPVALACHSLLPSGMPACRPMISSCPHP